jgi:hypothetical protein
MRSGHVNTQMLYHSGAVTCYVCFWVTPLVAMLKQFVVLHASMLSCHMLRSAVLDASKHICHMLLFVLLGT